MRALATGGCLSGVLLEYRLFPQHVEDRHGMEANHLNLSQFCNEMPERTKNFAKCEVFLDYFAICKVS
jgi:predicted membrane chloride channel (bestrophin family)